MAKKPRTTKDLREIAEKAAKSGAVQVTDYHDNKFLVHNEKGAVYISGVNNQKLSNDVLKRFIRGFAKLGIVISIIVVALSAFFILA